MNSEALPRSEHFTFHRLAEGIWAAIALSAGLAGSNSGIVDTGDHTVVFDTTLSPASASDLRMAAEQLTGRPVSCVLNSHMDRDHVFGNAVFSPETIIYSTTRTRELMSEQTSADMLEFKKKWPELQAQWVEGARVTRDEAERVDYEEGVKFAQRIIDTFPQMQVRLPDHVFDDQLELQGSKRTIQFLTYGGGHTDSDAILVAPADRIIFTGDLFVVKNHPALFKGHPRQWLDILVKIKGLDPVHLVPGHGGLGTQTELMLIERYIQETLQMAQENRRAGGTGESAAALQPPAFAEGWDNGDIFGENMKFLHEVVQGKN
ncbi:MAG: MBL fold metallo-hydrolase [Chloroflexi bacterium]|jgi:glyoxylase-like metal-dependent hydrolase (beta-lactamase superfamily II)|nr:MBL fold metallo-hydrolase [Chloroflexota bacterium]